MGQARYSLWTVALVLTLGPFAAAANSTRACDSSPRLIGAFGAMDVPKPPLATGPEITSQLPEGSLIRGEQVTEIAPSGERIIMYDAKDDSEPNPRIAIVVNAAIVKTYEISKLVEYGEGATYATSCEFEIAPGQRALAVAYTLSGDGTGSAFIVLTWWGGEYRVAFHRTVGQGRLVLGSGTLRLWERTFGKYASRPDSDKFECEWCKHKYLITELAWQHGDYVKTRIKRTPTSYDPAEITGTPILIETKP